MSDSFTPTYVGGICNQCHTGEMYQYPQDVRDQLRCGRCGELGPEPQAEIAPTEDTPFPYGTIIQVPARPRTNRRKAA